MKTLIPQATQQALLCLSLLAGAFAAAPLVAAPFVRGDVDVNGTLDITDPLTTVGYLFLGEPSALTCPDAADVDDTGELDIADVVYLLSYLFLAGAPPQPPFPRCGIDPTEDTFPRCEPSQNCFCGGFIGIPCDADEACDIAPGLCGGADLPGTCVPVPDGCPKNIDPVCGCDGVTYTNDCERLKAGAQKDHDGECGAPCGGLGNPPCAEGFFCDFPAGTCGAADESGDCREIGSGLCPAIFDPVCGCDGVTYSNDCARLAAGVSLLHEGACEEQ